MLVSGIASVLPDGPVKVIVTLIAVPVGVVARAVCIWAEASIADYVRIKEVESRYNAAVKAIEEALKNPGLSEVGRLAFQQQRIELDEEMIIYRRSRITEKMKKK